MFKAIFLSELKKLQYSKMLRIIIIVFIATLVLFAGTVIAMNFLVDSMQSTIPPGMENNPMFDTSNIISPLLIFTFYSSGGTGIFTILFSAIVAAFVGKEYNTTLRQTMISVENRKEYYFAKLLVLSIIFFVYTILTLLSFTLVYGLIMGFSTITFANPDKILLASISLLFVMWGLVSLFMMLVILLKNKVNIILIVLGTGFLIDIITTLFGFLNNKTIYNLLSYFPTNQLMSILTLNPDIKHIIGGFVTGILMLIGSAIIGPNLLEKQDL